MPSRNHDGGTARVELDPRSEAASEDLAECNRRLHDLARAQRVARLGSWELDGASGRMVWSDELYRLLEYAPDQVDTTLERLLQRVHADDIDRLRQALGAGDGSTLSVDEEVRVVLPGERQRWLAFRARRLLSPHEGPELHGTVQDISEQTRARDRLEVLVAERSAEAAQLREVVALAHVALGSATAKDLIDTALTAVVETLDVERAAFVTYRAGEETIVLEQSSPDCPPGQVVSLSRAPRIQAALQTADPVPVDARDCDRLLGASGAGVWVTVRVAGKPYGAIVACRDKGDIAGQGRFMRSVADLCGSAIEREEQDRRRSEFVATASHELRTPATSILGFLELLVSGEAGQLTLDQHHMLEAIERNGKRLMALIENLLAGARMDSGMVPLVVRPVDVRGLVDGAVKAVQTQLGSRSLELLVDVAPALPSIGGDSEQLERVLINLLTNGIKYTLDGGRITVRAGDRGGGEVEIAVEDTGVGIPEEELKRVFDRFFRASTAKDAAAPGTGLGMAIVKSIVDRHDGHIELRSTPGKGTTVLLALPVHGAEKAPAAPAPRPPASTRTTPQRQPEPVPTVDTSPRVVLDALRLLLRAQTGEEVMAAVVDAVLQFGGTVAPPARLSTGQLPFDVTFGVGDPLLPTGDQATLAALADVLPALVEDAHVALERARVQRHLTQWASADPLTRLANRRTTMRELARLRLGDTVVKADLDHLKRVNDLHGHDAGDAVLRSFARVLADLARPGDTAGRLDGEEFVLLLPRTDTEDARRIVDSLQRSWAEVGPEAVTFSAGVAPVGPSGPRDALDFADEAVRSAKRQGLQIVGG